MKRINRKAAERLLLDILAEQAVDELTDTEPQISDERFQEILYGGEFNQEERRILLTSPVTRERFVYLAQAAKARKLLQWRQAKLAQEPVQLLAASDKKVRRLHLKQHDFKIDVIPLDPAGTRWKVWLAVSDKYRDKTVTPNGLRLVDEQGQTWLAGKPDDKGELSGMWPLDESPMDAPHTVWLEPL